MDTNKKTLNAPDLADKIIVFKENNPGMSEKDIMAKIRKTAKFSKDKWKQAKEILAMAKTGTEKSSEQRLCDVDTNAEDHESIFFDVLDDLGDSAEEFVANMFADLQKHPNNFATVNMCPKASPTLQSVLDMAVEAGLLKEIHAYAIGDDFIPCKKNSKKKTCKTAKKS